MTAKTDAMVGNFRILGPIPGARGSQGAVFRAVCERAADEMPDLAEGDVVALKIMPCDDRGDVLLRLKKRLQTIRQTGHANVVKYYGAFRFAGEFNLQIAVVMELLEGDTLKERISKSRGGLDADEALRIVDLALRGLSATEAVGIVHRDIKPSNIFLCRDGGVKIVDFGVATQKDAQASTASGRFAGTFDYMAPEFSNDEFRGTAQSDVFSMGVVLHEALTGQLPYAQLKGKGQSADFAYLSRWSLRQEGLCAIRIKSSVERVLDGATEVLARALEVNPGKRYGGAEAFRVALGKVRCRDLKGRTEAYRFLKMIGKGGFGEVYKARVLGSDELVAVKRLLNPAYGDRFRRERDVMCRLDDPSFVRFVDYIDVGYAGGTDSFLVMAYLPEMPGSSLRDAIRRAGGRPLPPVDVITAFVIYARALGRMHERKLFHRDIKPSNLYYPEGHPERSVVMDLGIARDGEGTQTVGQVPGTLDYMPPEVVGDKSRGDAGMDFYALGLCLYEALTGATAYPRLPSGPDALAAFYARVSAKVLPKFDAEPVAGNRRLLDLIGSMTELDERRRLSTAEDVVRHLESILAEIGGNRLPSPIPPNRSMLPVPIDDPRTAETDPTAIKDGAELSGTGVSPWRNPWLRRAIWILSAVAALAVVWTPASALIGLGHRCAMKWIDERNKKMHEQEIRLAEAARAAFENEMRNRCICSASDLVARIDDDQVSDDSLKIEHADWLGAWRTNQLVSALVAQAENDFATAFSRRSERMAEREKRRLVDSFQDDARSVVALWNGHGNETNDCAAKTTAWVAKWRSETRLPQGARVECEQLVAKAREERCKWEDDQVRRSAEFADKLARHRKLAGECEKAADAVVAAYGDENVELAAADVRRTQWEVAWSKYGDTTYLAPLQGGEGFYAPARRRIERARAERLTTDRNFAYLNELSRRLDAIVNVSDDHAAADFVGRWRSRLTAIEVEVRKAVDDGRITGAQSEKMRSRINEMKEWTVGIVDNRSEVTAEFGGVEIEPYGCRPVVFRGPFPEWAAIRGDDDSEPIRVLRERFDAQVFKVLRFDTMGKCVAIVPRFGTNVTCIIGGLSRRPGRIMLKRGRHYVCYRNGLETYPGIRDYLDKEYPFDTVTGETVEVPPVSGAWTETSEFRTRRQQEQSRKRAEEIVRECRENLKPEPAETRRARLEKVHALLNDWKTPSALRILGAGVERDLHREYEDERALFRGYVKNESRVRVSVDANGVKTSVPPGERKLVTFTSWDGLGKIEIDGVECLALPSDRTKFDGREFVVTEKKLVKLKVRVTMPELADDETCEVDGRKLMPVDELLPGDYKAVYRRPGKRDREVRFRVEIATPMTVPR